jgi:hypothetical protein
MQAQTLIFNGVLSAKVTQVDGSIVDLGIVSGRPLGELVVAKDPARKAPWYERLWTLLRAEGKIPLTMGLTAFIAYELQNYTGHLGHPLYQLPGMLALVTTTGQTYVAADFASGGASPHVSAINYHDFGTGGAHGSSPSISSASNVGSQLQLTFGSAHGATSNDIWLITGVTGTGLTSPTTWQVTVISATVLALVGFTASGSYTASSATGQLVNGAADTALTTAAGTARVAGTQTNPSSGVYQSVATVSFTSSLAIVEWGLFTAASSGTLYDRRWLNNLNSPAVTATGALTAATINVVNGMSISMTYTLTLASGGS